MGNNRDFWKRVLGDRFSEFEAAADRGLFPTRDRPLSVHSHVNNGNVAAMNVAPARRFGEYSMFMGA